jgi:hypothetical protein
MARQFEEQVVGSIGGYNVIHLYALMGTTKHEKSANVYILALSLKKMHENY